ncbi:hypothetical protein TRAPUB_2896 [Trametes pubescens]|uniref:Uncharacterized protein n=1 Tax=Trametes pubescens TaxID=154538 RepID=A0A1M2VFE1_TRAPU|nr:hypothetical protein TRAPUB_2896 [Trametes pubescens]
MKSVRDFEEATPTRVRGDGKSRTAMYKTRLPLPKTAPDHDGRYRGKEGAYSGRERTQAAV